MAIQRKQLNRTKIICLLITVFCILSVNYIKQNLRKGYYILIYPTTVAEAQILDKQFRGTSEGDFYEYDVEYSVGKTKIRQTMSIWKEVAKEYAVGEKIKIRASIKKPGIAELATNIDAVKWKFISCFIIMGFFVFGVIGLFIPKHINIDKMGG